MRQGTQRDAVLYSVGANAVHGLRRTNADKRRAVETLVRDEEWGAWSNREIARRCGVSHEFVNQERASLATVASERTYTTKHGTVSTMNTAAIGRTPEAASGREEAGDNREAERYAAFSQANGTASKPAPVAVAPPPTGSRDGDEWFTPEKYAEAVRQVLNGVELDPASCNAANLTVKADRIYTKDDDGLAYDWRSRALFCSPPYSGSEKWVARLVEEFEAEDREADERAKGRPLPPAPSALARGSLSPTPFATWMASELRTLSQSPAAGPTQEGRPASWTPSLSPP